MMLKIKLLTCKLVCIVALPKLEEFEPQSNFATNVSVILEVSLVSCDILTKLPQVTGVPVKQQLDYTLGQNKFFQILAHSFNVISCDFRERFENVTICQYSTIPKIINHEGYLQEIDQFIFSIWKVFQKTCARSI